MRCGAMARAVFRGYNSLRITYHRGGYLVPGMYLVGKKKAKSLIIDRGMFRERSSAFICYVREQLSVTRTSAVRYY